MNTMHSESTVNESTHEVAFSPQVNTQQIQLVAQQGYKTVICNRPDGEELGQPSISEIATACQELGLAFKAIPFSGGMLSQTEVEEFAEFFNNAEQPVYMYCRSGNRSGLLYQAAMKMGLLT